ncbi:hypothetical protein JCGZ_18423 [Jatropha curcas]|uniref:Uncharacterized protein n=1 Tax=Jatropha curcas TaxID=180498 RepID=A0A067K483_JATCU|nr:hypothetical protein JCGZ_18423 [Jatropha curcas]
MWDNVLADDTEYSGYVNGLGRSRGRRRGRCRGRAKVYQANVNRDNSKGKRATAVGTSYSFRHRVQQEQPLDRKGGQTETVADSQSTDDDCLFWY